MARSQVARPEPVGDEELKLLGELMVEQTPNAVARAVADARKTSATWIGKGDHLLLLVVDATSAKKTKRTLYKCRVLDLVVEETPR